MQINQINPGTAFHRSPNRIIASLFGAVYVLVGLLGGVGVERWLRRAGSSSAPEELAHDLPLACDLVAVCLAAGMPPAEALAAVAEALLTATEEALRNSLRHAGPANLTVHVTVRDGGVEVNVLDDGVGFDPAAVPGERLGIAQSIEARMRDAAGGSAQVVSTPGVGTRVVLGWSAP